MDMATIQKFEDIDTWKKARILTKYIYTMTTDKKFSKDFHLREQIRKASTTIMLNIAEGFARRTDKDFARFLTQAHGSAAEVQATLYIALDQLYINNEEFGTLYKEVDEISRMIRGLENYLRGK